MLLKIAMLGIFLLTCPDNPIPLEPMGVCEITAYVEDGTFPTKSGVLPVVGRTVAVDPDFIPMGSWMWIEGVGLRKAEDTGGLVKDNVVDVYWDGYDSAMEWGRRERRVWVIEQDG